VLACLSCGVGFGRRVNGPRNEDGDRSFSSSYSFSSYSSMGEDGEPRSFTQHTVRDSSGRDETIQRRQLGDRVWVRRSDEGDMYDMLQDMDEEGLEQDWLSEPTRVPSRLSGPARFQDRDFSLDSRLPGRFQLASEDNAALDLYGLLSKGRFGGAPSGSSRSYSSYSSTGPDGQIRSHSTRTFRDADGQEYSIERRQLGDRVWEIETDGDDVMESYEGMDEDELDEFDEEWMGDVSRGRFLRQQLDHED